jgi:hypothetical protein
MRALSHQSGSVLITLLHLWIAATSYLLLPLYHSSRNPQVWRASHLVLLVFLAAAVLGLWQHRSWARWLNIFILASFGPAFTLPFLILPHIDMYIPLNLLCLCLLPISIAGLAAIVWLFQKRVEFAS